MAGWAAAGGAAEAAARRRRSTSAAASRAASRWRPAAGTVHAGPGRVLPRKHPWVLWAGPRAAVAEALPLAQSAIEPPIAPGPRLNCHSRGVRGPLRRRAPPAPVAVRTRAGMPARPADCAQSSGIN